MNVKVYPPTAKQRLMDTVVPLANVERATNKVLAAIPQVPGIGWGNCVPKDAGRRLKEHLDGQSKYSLMEHIGHAKRRCIENVTQYIDGKLPVWIRRVKYELDRIKVLQYAAQLVGTAKFLRSLLQKEVELANHYCNEGIAIVNFAESNLTPAGLRTQAEHEVAAVLQQARADLESQIEQNNASLECLI